MTSASEYSTDTARRRTPAEALRLRRLPSGNLSDRQALVAVMIADGRTCEDIASDLFLPVRTVQGHLDRAMEVLGLSSVEELTHQAVASHSAVDLPAATGPPPGSRPGPFIARPRESALAVLDAAEAARAADEEADERGALRRELDATRALLEQKLDKLQQLQQAVISRDTIGQAKGILMERHKVSADGAFAMLQDQSSRTNLKLVKVAEHLIYSGREDIPDPSRDHHEPGRRT
ncbi:ANTAR domain-containing protein [Arthrobacter sp. B0490]|uniref:ANTAR domain-containing protein n=1 Tax=Arthrobacter sp. B0490 TaxID=2058891 RepID=UPI001CA5230A|nr:ANTAR domain-containing protein [Arthrobacter sp. B0490]